MINKAIIEKDFTEHMSSCDTTWASIAKLEPLAVFQMYFMLAELAEMFKLSAAEHTPLNISGDSEFLQAVDGKDSSKVWAVIDELMDTIRATAPRAYDSVMRKIKEIDHL